MSRILIGVVLAVYSGVAAYGQADPGPSFRPEGPEPTLPMGLEEQEEPALPPGLGNEPGLPQEIDEPSLPLEVSTPEDEPPSWLAALRLAWDARFGSRLSNDATQREDLTLLESRLQLKTEKIWGRSVVDARLDLLVDGLESGIEIDLRQFRLTLRLTESVDLQIGRQILTWGTGDLLFINDLFPKDWQAFLLGRKSEYLKAPSDAVRIGWFPSWGNFELVYIPRFDSDRFLSGERLSFFDPLIGGFRGGEQSIRADVPDSWFEDDELALRISDEVGSFELALYGYRGFWKNPAGFDPVLDRGTFPGLDVVGASVRGPWGRGIANFELGHYNSREDADGNDPTIDNSELRVLLGYELELGRELTGGIQLYLERLDDYASYLRTLPVGIAPRNETRTLVTVRLGKLLRSQTLRLSLFAFFSPSDRDAHVRSRIEIDLSDRWSFEVGGHIFFGEENHTFFGQLKDNSSLFTAWRFSR